MSKEFAWLFNGYFGFDVGHGFMVIISLSWVFKKYYPLTLTTLMKKLVKFKCSYVLFYFRKVIRNLMVNLDITWIKIFKVI